MSEIEVALREVDEKLAWARQSAAATKEELLSQPNGSRIWNARMRAETKPIYQLLERRWGLNLLSRWPTNLVLFDVQVVGIKLPPAMGGKLLNLQHIREGTKLSVRIYDTVMFQIGPDGKVTFANPFELKSDGAKTIRGVLARSIKGGMLTAKEILANFRPSSTIEKQIQKEDSKVKQPARDLRGTIVLEGYDVVTGKRHRLEVDPERLRISRIVAYDSLPDFIFSTRPQKMVIPQITTKPEVEVQPRNKKKLDAATSTVRPDFFSIDNKQRGISSEAKMCIKEPFVNRMTNRLVPGTGSAVGGYALGIILSEIGDRAAADRFEEALKNQGWVPRGSEYLVGRGSSLAQRIGRAAFDPAVMKKINAIPLHVRFNVALWRESIRKKASAKKVGESLTIWFPVVSKDGKRYGEGSTTFEKTTMGTDDSEWIRISRAIPLNTLQENLHLNIEKIINPGMEDESIENYLRLVDALRESRHAAEELREIREGVHV